MKLRMGLFLIVVLSLPSTWASRALPSTHSRAAIRVPTSASKRVVPAPVLKTSGIAAATAGQTHRFAPAVQRLSPGLTGSTGYGGISAPIVNFSQPTVDNSMSDILKSLGLATDAKMPEARPILPAMNPIPPAHREEIVRAPEENIRTPAPWSDARIPKMTEAQDPAGERPQCLGESSGALMIGSSACNAFHVGGGLAMTNCHCTGRSGQSLKSGTFAMISNGVRKNFRCDAVLNCSSELDYSVVSCPQLSDEVPVVQLADKRPGGGEKIYISTHDFRGRGISKVVRTGTVNGRIYDVRDGSRVSMLAWASSIKGNSGSGVFNSENEVTGLLWGGFKMARTNTLFTPMVDVMKHMEKHNPQVYQRIQTAQRAVRQGGREIASQCRKPERVVASQNATVGRD